MLRSGPEGTCTQISSLDRLSLTVPLCVGVRVHVCSRKMYVAMPAGIPRIIQRYKAAHLWNFWKEVCLCEFVSLPKAKYYFRFPRDALQELWSRLPTA